MTVLERLWKRSTVDSHSGCWEWQGKRKKSTPKSPHMLEYGVIVITKDGKKSSLSTHRLSYYLHNGDIPDGMFVLHKCDNPACWNPEHLYLGTHGRNMQDITDRNRRKGSNHPRATITEQQAEEIKSTPSTYGSAAKLAAKFGISKHVIHNIRSGKAWKETSQQGG